MVSVAPVAIVRLALTLYGPLAAVHVVLAAIVPLTLCVVLSSYQTSTVTRSNSVPFASSDCTRTRLIPGVSATEGADHVPCQPLHVAGVPLISTLRVSIALAVPESATVGVVVCG